VVEEQVIVEIKAVETVAPLARQLPKKRSALSVAIWLGALESFGKCRHGS